MSDKNPFNTPKATESHDPLAQFRVQQLTPYGEGGGPPTRGETYQLTKSSVSPTAIVGYDKKGRPIEETIPIAYSQKWLTSDGCINNVPMRTGAIKANNSDATAYEYETTVDLIIAGWIPLWMCPYSTAYAPIKGGPFVQPPPGATDCGGQRDGCEHLHTIKQARAADVRRAHQEEADEMMKMSGPEAQEFLRRMTASFEMLRVAATPASTDPLAPQNVLAPKEPR